MVTLAEVKAFWSAKDGEIGQGETTDIIRRIHKSGFAEGVPEDVAEYMTAWADADPGDGAAYFAHKTIDALGLPR